MAKELAKETAASKTAYDLLVDGDYSYNQALSDTQKAIDARIAELKAKTEP